VPPGQEAARQALELARKEHNRALSAEALYRLSVQQETVGEFDAAEASVDQALVDAESSGHERLLPLIWTQFITVVGIDKYHPDEVDHLVPVVEAMVERIDPQGPAHIEFLLTLGELDNVRGRYESAVEHLNAALDMSRRVFGEHNIRRVEIYRQLTNAE